MADTPDLSWIAKLPDKAGAALKAARPYLATPYSARIRELAPAYDPRHIEAYMRSEHGTLDKLSGQRFAAEVRVAVLCIKHGGVEMAERLARSYGF